METGEAAPRLLAGVMAAVWLAHMTKVPDLAARAPPGLTKVAIGMGEDNIWRMIERMELSRPPGVSSSSTASIAPLSWACVRPRWMKSALAGLMMPSTLSTVTRPPAELAGYGI